MRIYTHFDQTTKSHTIAIENWKSVESAPIDELLERETYELESTDEKDFVLALRRLGTRAPSPDAIQKATDHLQFLDFCSITAVHLLCRHIHITPQVSRDQVREALRLHISHGLKDSEVEFLQSGVQKTASRSRHVQTITTVPTPKSKRYWFQLSKAIVRILAGLKTDPSRSSGPSTPSANATDDLALSQKVAKHLAAGRHLQAMEEIASTLAHRAATDLIASLEDGEANPQALDKFTSVIKSLIQTNTRSAIPAFNTVLGELAGRRIPKESAIDLAWCLRLLADGAESPTQTATQTVSVTVRDDPRYTYASFSIHGHDPITGRFQTTATRWPEVRLDALASSRGRGS